MSQHRRRRSRPQQPEASSWGELLAAREAARKQAPPAPAVERGPRRKFRDPRYSRAEEQSKYDPVRHRYRREEDEVRARRSEDARKIERVNRAKDYAMRAESKWNVITHEPRVRCKETEPPPERTERYEPPSRTYYNIISNKPLDEHHFAPPELRPEVPPENEAKSTLAARVETREFDIISNKYFVDDESRQQEDLDRGYERATRKYWEQNVYNPVAGQYYDEEAERRFQTTRELEAATHGRTYAERLPPAVRESEGTKYNIVNGSAVDKEGLENLDRRRSARKAWRKKKYEVEAGQQKRAVDRMDREAEHYAWRSANSPSNYRAAHGYNIVNNVPFQGRTGRPPKNWKPKKEETLWDAVQNIPEDRTLLSAVQRANAAMDRRAHDHQAKTARKEQAPRVARRRRTSSASRVAKIGERERSRKSAVRVTSRKVEPSSKERSTARYY